MVSNGYEQGYINHPSNYPYHPIMTRPLNERYPLQYNQQQMGMYGPINTNMPLMYQPITQLRDAMANQTLTQHHHGVIPLLPQVIQPKNNNNNDNEKSGDKKSGGKIQMKINKDKIKEFSTNRKIEDSNNGNDNEVEQYNDNDNDEKLEFRMGNTIYEISNRFLYVIDDEFLLIEENNGNRDGRLLVMNDDDEWFSESKYDIGEVEIRKLRTVGQFKLVFENKYNAHQFILAFLDEKKKDSENILDNIRIEPWKTIRDLENERYTRGSKNRVMIE